MAKNKHRISLRLTDEEVLFLEKIASNNKMYKKDGSLSMGLAIKRLIDDEKNHVNKSDKDDSDMKSIRKLIEQINISIPHLMFNTNFTYKALSSWLNDDEFNELKNSTVSETVKTCGQIQENTYNEIYISSNKKNMKTIPIDSDNNKWK